MRNLLSFGATGAQSYCAIVINDVIPRQVMV